MDGRSDCVGETRMDHNISPKQRKRAAEVDAAAIFLQNAFHPAEGRGVSLPRSIHLGPSRISERSFFTETVTDSAGHRG